MSPKKKRKRTAAGGGAGARSGAPADASDDTGRADTGTAPAATATASGISRTPLVLDDRRRWPVAVWTVLASVWVLGSLVFFVLFMAEGFALLGTADKNGESDIASKTTAVSYLLAMVACALLVPLAGAVWAMLLRRKIAAILFLVALGLSAAVLFSLGSPADITGAIATGITSG